MPSAAAKRHKAGEQEPWAAKRRMIVDVAAEVFFERGFQRGTTKEIAEKVGLTQSAIYHYVGSKDDLLSEIARQVDHDFSGALERALASSDDPVRQLREIIRSFVDMMAIDHKAYGVYWTEQRSIQTDVKEQTDADQAQYLHRVEGVVAAVQSRGVLPAGRPTRVIAEAIIGMMSWLYWWYTPGGHHRADEIADAFCELIGLAE